jgi:flagellar protein FliO/FliZ
MKDSKRKFTAAVIFLLLLVSVFALSAQENSSLPKDNRTESQKIEDSIEFNLDSDEIPPQQKVSRFSGFFVFLRMIFVLAIVVAAIWFLFRFVKKTALPDEISDDDEVFLRRVSSVSLGAGKSVQIVSLWNRAFILGVSDNNVSLLQTVDDKELVDAMNRYADMHGKTKKPKSFEEILELFMPKKNPSQSSAENQQKSALEGDDETMNLIKALKEKHLSGEGGESR